ncbi:MAG: hypothetical protein OEV79_07980 [candidate division WOR-3 bacterium]|nr:hypothetical protein [candidate division WOR-3 bacterium]
MHYIRGHMPSSLQEVATLPEIIFFSIYVCVVILNVNIDGKKGGFETTIRVFICIILALNFFTMGMIYSDNLGVNVVKYVALATIFPTIIAPIYKFLYIRKGVL